VKVGKKSHSPDNREGRVPRDKFGNYPKRYSKPVDVSLGRIAPDVIRDKSLIGKSLLEEVASEIAVFLKEEVGIDEFADLEYLSKENFSEPWMGKFLYAFIRLGSITEAGKCVGVSSFEILKHLNSDEVFRRYYEDAKVIRSDKLLSEAFERAVHGVKEFYFRDGKLVRDEKGLPLMVSRYNDDLLKFLLKALVPAFQEKLEVEHSGVVETKVVFQKVDGIEEYAERVSKGHRHSL
jgi:hypothetical protein